MSSDPFEFPPFEFPPLNFRMITANQANAGLRGPGGAPGGALAGTGGARNGVDGQIFPGTAGGAGLSGFGIGGGHDPLTNSVVIDNTNISGNSASSADNDVSS
jgi:hypothetical protein